MLTISEMEIIKECIILLKPFESATKDISGDKYVSASLVIPLANCIKTAFERIKLSNSLIILLQSELKKQIENRLNQLEASLFLSAATILGPRFKKLHFTSPLCASTAISILSDEIKQSLKGQGTSSSPLLPSTLPLPSTSTPSELTTGTNIWSIHDEFVARQCQTEKTVK